MLDGKDRLLDLKDCFPEEDVFIFFFEDFFGGDLNSAIHIPIIFVETRSGKVSVNDGANGYSIVFALRKISSGK